jgi:quinol monooxygenase YgiN
VSSEQKGDFMVGLEILVSIQPDKRQEFLQTIELFRSQQDRNKACTGCSIFETVDTPNQFLWVEKWTDRGALDEYMKTDRFRALLGVIQVLGGLNNLHIAEIKMQNDLPGCFYKFR